MSGYYVGDMIPDSFVKYENHYLYAVLAGASVTPDRYWGNYIQAEHSCPVCTDVSYKWGAFKDLGGSVNYMYCLSCHSVWQYHSVLCLTCPCILPADTLTCPDCDTTWEYDILYQAYLSGDIGLNMEDL